MMQAQPATLTTQDVYGKLILGRLVAGGGFEPPTFGL
jgi:hypothetical protein